MGHVGLAEIVDDPHGTPLARPHLRMPPDPALVVAALLAVVCPAAGAEPRALVPSELAALSNARGARVANVPLDADGMAELDLTRVGVFAPGARVDLAGAGGTTQLSPPDDVYFTGTVAGDPGSLAMLAVGAAGVRGSVTTAGRTYVLVPDGAGGHRVEPLPLAGPSAEPAPDCSVLDEAGGAAPVTAAPEGASGISLRTGLLIDLALETDYELRARFPSDEAAVAAVAAAVAAVAAIFRRDLAVTLRLSYLRLWTTPADPWTRTDKAGALAEVRTYWSNPANGMAAVAGPHDVAHFLTGKSSIGGGQAYLNTLCTETVTGITRYTRGDAQDVQFLAHELGHNLGSPHSHCYRPAPLDMCYNREAGCYDGPIVPSVGTIMSYCHLLRGYYNEDVFHPATVALVRPRVEARACVSSVCGAFLTEPEVCDDGDSCTVDGCAGECTNIRIPGCCHDARDCDDAEPCTIETCESARCTHALAPDGTSCSDDACGPATCMLGTCRLDLPPTGYTGVGCALATLRRLVDEAYRAKEMTRGLRTTLRRLVREARRRLTVAARASHRARLGRELRALRSLGRILGRLDRVIVRAAARAAPPLSGTAAARLRTSLGSARGNLAGLEAALAPPAPPS
jgi:hypothetical protein